MPWPSAPCAVIGREKDDAPFRCGGLLLAFLLRSVSCSRVVIVHHPALDLLQHGLRLLVLASTMPWLQPPCVCRHNAGVRSPGHEQRSDGMAEVHMRAS